jgi:hypothetical protein
MHCLVSGFVLEATSLFNIQIRTLPSRTDARAVRPYQFEVGSPAEATASTDGSASRPCQNETNAQCRASLPMNVCRRSSFAVLVGR